MTSPANEVGGSGEAGVPADTAARWQAVEQVRETLEAHVKYADAIGVPETAAEESYALAALVLLQETIEEADRAVAEYEHGDEVTDGTMVALSDRLARVRAGAGPAGDTGKRET